MKILFNIGHPTRVPLFENLIGETLDGIPDYVTRVYAVDDGSDDRAGAVIVAYAWRDPRIVPILVQSIRMRDGNYSDLMEQRNDERIRGST